MRQFFDDATALRARLDRLDAVWRRGGNTFMVRYALLRSGGDVLLTEAPAVAARYAGAGVPHRTLRDGQVLVINGADAHCERPSITSR